MYVWMLLHFFFLLYVPILDFPTRKTWWPYIYQSESCGSCKDVLGNRTKT